MEFLTYLETLINLKKRQLSLINAGTCEGVIGPTIRPMGAFSDMDLNNISLPFWVTGELARPGDTYLGYISSDELYKAYLRGAERLTNIESLPEKKKIRFYSSHRGYWKRLNPSASAPDGFRDSRMVMGVVTGFRWDPVMNILYYIGYLTNMELARNVIGEAINAVSMGFDYGRVYENGKLNLINIDITEITCTTDPHITTATMKPLLENQVVMNA